MGVGGLGRVGRGGLEYLGEGVGVPGMSTEYLQRRGKGRGLYLTLKFVTLELKYYPNSNSKP